MNSLSIAQELSALPDGVLIENRRQRITVQLGLAVGIVMALPAAQLPSGELRAYFGNNVGEVRTVLGQINEAIPLTLDRAVELGYRVWVKRYECAYAPKASDLFSGNCLGDIVPEIGELKITAQDVQRGVAMLNEGLAV